MQRRLTAWNQKKKKVQYIEHFYEAGFDFQLRVILFVDCRLPPHNFDLSQRQELLTTFDFYSLHLNTQCITVVYLYCFTTGALLQFEAFERNNGLFFFYVVATVSTSVPVTHSRHSHVKRRKKCNKTETEAYPCTDWTRRRYNNSLSKH